MNDGNCAVRSRFRTELQSGRNQDRTAAFLSTPRCQNCPPVAPYVLLAESAKQVEVIMELRNPRLESLEHQTNESLGLVRGVSLC
jgi:hypothetical protein